MSDERPHVLWFGAAPTSAQRRELDNRRRVVIEPSFADPLEHALTASAAVVNLGLGTDSSLLSMTRDYAGELVDYGLRIDVIARDDAATGRIQKKLELVTRLDAVRLHTAPSPATLAEGIARHDAGSQPRLNLNFEMAPGREPLRKADAILFKRAFAQCSAISLVELGGGRSDARVFAVHMTVDRSDIGVWPQPKFVKLDERAKIEREFTHYRDYAERFIPFGLRPNINHHIIGSERSLLVGDFVDRSESLWDLARHDAASKAITALLEETLGGWRDQGYARDPISGSVARAMQEAGIWNPDCIQAQYVERAKEHGVFLGPKDLTNILMSLHQRYRVVPVHGDLHGENVRVRGSSAILIDLASVARGPLTADLAGLETWLAFECPPESDPNQFQDREWQDLIQRLYAPETFRHPPGPCRPSSRLAWISSVVRQIRTLGIAIQACQGEYETAVAVQLLRRCQWADGPPADRGRRGFGYRIAAQLIEDLKDITS